jgi:hypothetical protein
MNQGTLVHYVIYDHPKDYPGFWIVRRWFIDKGRITPEACASAHLTLADARDSIPHGLVRLERSPDDSPSIKEVWL